MTQVRREFVDSGQNYGSYLVISKSEQVKSTTD